MSHQQANVEPRFEGQVSAAFPLALLESVRSHDRPGEILEDEDLSISLPRRLGLTGVIETQIFRYEAAQKAGRSVRLDEVMGLIRLVMRRPDAEPILREAGQRMARWYFRSTPEMWVKVLHRAPNRLGLPNARRASLRALRGLQAGDTMNAAKPYTITVHNATTARLEENGTACILLTGLIEEQLLLATNKPRRVRHTCCSARGDSHCEWSLDG
jgi:predicted hydrocarbon binding protein